MNVRGWPPVNYYFPVSAAEQIAGIAPAEAPKQEEVQEPPQQEEPVDFLPVLTVKGGVPVVSSLELAERFDKRHDNVLRDIDELILTSSV